MLEENLINPMRDNRGFLFLTLPRFGFSLKGKGTALRLLLGLLREVMNTDIRVLTRQSFRDGEVLAALMLECTALETVSCGLDSKSLEAAVRFVGDKPLPKLRSLTMRMDPLLHVNHNKNSSSAFHSFMKLVLCQAPSLELLELSDCFAVDYREETSLALLAISDTLRIRNALGLPSLLTLRIPGIEHIADASGQNVVESFTQSLPKEIQPNLEIQGRFLLNLTSKMI